MEKTNPYPVSWINHQRVLYLIRTQGPISRAEIARQTNLTKATSSKIVEELERRNLICPVGIKQQGRGRPTMMYTFNNTAAVAIGVEIKEEEILAVVTQMDAQPLQSYTLPLSDPKPEKVIDILEQIVASVRQEFPNPIIGLGIGLPGICDDQHQIVLLSERLNWKDLPFAEMVRERIPLNVYVENRANAAALAERWYGSGRDCDNFAYVHIGSGIKAGIVLNGNLYSGSSGSSGEIGHLILVRDGPSCVCGKRGCLETLATPQAICERASALVRAGKAESLVQRFGAGSERLSIRDLLEAASQGDQVAVACLTEAAKFLGMALASLTNLLNPKKIILGPFANLAPRVFIDTVRQTVEENTFEMPMRGLEIIPTELSQLGVAIGAAALLLAEDLQALQVNIL